MPGASFGEPGRWVGVGSLANIDGTRALMPWLGSPPAGYAGLRVGPRALADSQAHPSIRANSRMAGAIRRLDRPGIAPSAAAFSYECICVRSSVMILCRQAVRQMDALPDGQPRREKFRHARPPCSSVHERIPHAVRLIRSPPVRWPRAWRHTVACFHVLLRWGPPIIPGVDPLPFHHHRPTLPVVEAFRSICWRLALASASRPILRTPTCKSRCLDDGTDRHP